MREYFSNFLFMDYIMKNEDSHSYVFQIMKYSFIPAFTTIFNFNDQGDLFYIILKGKVRISVPKTVQMELNSWEHYEVMQSQNFLSM